MLDGSSPRRRLIVFLGVVGFAAGGHRCHSRSWISQSCTQSENRSVTLLSLGGSFLLQLANYFRLLLSGLISPAPVPVSASNLLNVDSVLIGKVFDEVFNRHAIDASD